MTDASPGLCKYYEYVLSKIDSPDTNDVFNEKAFSKEEKSEDEEIYEELLENMDTDSDSVH
jgi:hypothetical protein